jgi:hypothetical protein
VRSDSKRKRTEQSVLVVVAWVGRDRVQHSNAKRDL